MDVTFRPAQPTDVDAAVPLILSSGPQAFAYVFQAHDTLDAATFLRHAFVSGKGQWGCQHHLIGERDGQVVAAGAAYTGADARSFPVTATFQFLSVYGIRHTPGVLFRGLRLEQYLPPPARDVLYVGHLGVVPQARSQGIGEALIAGLVAWQGPDHPAELDVAMDNPRAEALYRRLGFEVVAERPCSLKSAWAQVPGHRRMRRG